MSVPYGILFSSDETTPIIIEETSDWPAIISDLQAKHYVVLWHVGKKLAVLYDGYQRTTGAAWAMTTMYEAKSVGRRHLVGFRYDPADLTHAVILAEAGYES